LICEGNKVGEFVNGGQGMKLSAELLPHTGGGSAFLRAGGISACISHGSLIKYIRKNFGFNGHAGGTCVFL
jgi:hypothetical protein